MTNCYHLFVADKKNKSAWNEYLKNKKTVPALNAYEWNEILAETYQPEQRHFFVCDDTHQITGVLPIYAITDVKKKRHLFSSRQGLVADNLEVAALLADAARQFAQEQSAITTEISTAGVPFDLGHPCSEKHTLRLDLTKPQEAIWKGMRDKTRNAIRKGEKHGLVIRQGSELLNEFYRIYSTRMAQKNIPFHTRAFFESLLKRFNGQSEIYLARYHNKPIATMFVIYFGSTALYAYGGMLSGYEKYCPNQYLLWHIIQECYKKNIHLLDLGEASVGSGVYKFKTWFGGVPKSVYYYDLLQSPLSQAHVSSLAALLKITRRLPGLKKWALQKTKRFGRLV